MRSKDSFTRYNLFSTILCWNFTFTRRGMENGNCEQQEFAFELLLDEIRALGDRVAQNRSDWPRIISSARSLLRRLNVDAVMQSQRRIPDQAFAIATLQRIAYHDADAGGVQDIAEWCLSQWLRILQNDAQNVDALRGLFVPLITQFKLISSRTRTSLAVKSAARTGANSSRRRQFFKWHIQSTWHSQQPELHFKR